MVEYRSPDPVANPYLAFLSHAAALRLHGSAMTLPAPQEHDTSRMSEEETLPRSLNDAILLTEEEQSSFGEALGEHVFYAFITNKKAELDAYRMNVTQWELERYLPLL